MKTCKKVLFLLIEADGRGIGVNVNLDINTLIEQAKPLVKFITLLKLEKFLRVLNPENLSFALIKLKKNNNNLQKYAVKPVLTTNSKQRCTKTALIQPAKKNTNILLATSDQQPYLNNLHLFKAPRVVGVHRFDCIYV